MKYAFVIARVLLGLVFTVFGLNAFLHFFPSPPVPGLAGQFMGALLGSHYYVIAFGTELIGGTLLLSNRYVPLALMLLGPVIVNIPSFHMFLDSENMAPAIVVTVLWFVVFSQVRSSFAIKARRSYVNADVETHARACKGYFPIIREAAKDSRADSRVVAATIVVETWNRPALRRMVETRVTELVSLASRAIGTRRLDASLGVGQMKLTTAQWARRGFQASSKEIAFSGWDDISQIEYIADDRQNIRLVAQYLAYLHSRRYRSYEVAEAARRASGLAYWLLNTILAYVLFRSTQKGVMEK